MVVPQRNPVVRRAPRETDEPGAYRRLENAASEIGPRGSGPPDLDAVVRHINRLHMAKSLETARAIGEFVLETFYDADIQALRRPDHAGHLSLRKIAKHPDLEVSYSFIAQSIALVDQLKLLPQHLAEQLNFTQHRALVTVREAENKLVLAQRAVDYGLTAAQLRDEVARLPRVAHSAPHGRPRKAPITSVFKAICDVLQLVPTAGEGCTAFFDKRRSKSKDLEDLISVVEGLTERLRRLRASNAATVGAGPNEQ